MYRPVDRQVQPVGHLILYAEAQGQLESCHALAATGERQSGAQRDERREPLSAQIFAPCAEGPEVVLVAHVDIGHLRGEADGIVVQLRIPRFYIVRRALQLAVVYPQSPRHARVLPVLGHQAEAGLHLAQQTAVEVALVGRQAYTTAYLHTIFGFVLRPATQGVGQQYYDGQQT